MGCSKTNEKGGTTIIETRCNEVPTGDKYLRVENFNPRDSNTLITNYYQDGKGTLKTYAQLDIATMLMEEPCFDILRTKEQLGYSVFSMLRNTFGILGLSITVNSQVRR